MDYLSLKAAVSEAAAKLTRTYISDAWQADRYGIVLMPRRGQGVILSVEPGRPGLFLYDRHKLPERFRSPFTDLLRTRIKGTTLISVEIPEHGERLVSLTFAGAWPDKKGTPLKLMLEVMGRRSNLMLTESGRILWPLRTVPKEKSPARPVLAGEIYQPPPLQPGIPLEDISLNCLPTPASPDAGQYLSGRLRGLSPQAASQVLRTAVQDTEGIHGETVPSGEAVIRTIKKMLASCSGESGFLYRSGGRIYLSPFRPLPYDKSDIVERYSPFSTAAVKWRESGIPDPNEVHDEAAWLERRLHSRLERISSAMVHLDTEEKRCRSHAESRVMAEALLISSSDVKVGSSSVELPDPYNADLTLTIPLDRSKSPQENANDLFAKARRLKRGLEEVRLRRAVIEDELRTVQEALQGLLQKEDLESARKVLEGTETRTAGKGKHSRAIYRGPGRRYMSEGFTILVGRNSVDNEKITFRAAGPNDLWLHVRDYPGSHVVILADGRNVPEKVLYEAAALAAAGSGARNDSAPEVMVAERKWVRKLKGGKPGQVTVEKYRTIRPRKRDSGSRRPK